MRGNRIFWAVAALIVTMGPASVWAAADARSEYGVTLAVSGEEARAESLFITMLSHTRGDARALNNLGNIRLLRGETSVALAFYDRALRGDSLDAGIHLNRATALLVMGDTERSEKAFARGVKLAGGVERARRQEDRDRPRAGPRDAEAGCALGSDRDGCGRDLQEDGGQDPVGVALGRSACIRRQRDAGSPLLEALSL